jgi:hypothetical protein
MSAHIAIARLARAFEDRDTAEFAEKALESDLTEGKDTTKIEARQKKTRFGKFSEKRNAGAFAGQPFMFLDASPDMMRFIKDNVKDQAIARVRRIEAVYLL